MNDEILKTYYQIITDTWKMFKEDVQTIRPNTEYLEVVTGRYIAYEQKWKYTPYWSFAGRECSAKLQEIERIWKEIREEHNEQNS